MIVNKFFTYSLFALLLTAVQSHSEIDKTLNPNLNSGKTYSFRAKDLGFFKTLQLFAKSNKFELECDSLDSPLITINANMLTLSEILDQIVVDNGFGYEMVGNSIIITKGAKKDSVNALTSKLLVFKFPGGRLFKLNYPRLKRGGTGSSQAALSSSAGSVTLNTSDEILFWSELEEQLKALVGSEGNLVISKFSGLIHLSAPKATLDAVQLFLDKTCGTSLQQVEITARIYEVNLNKESSFGINWTSVNNKLSDLSISGLKGLATGKIDVISKNADYHAATTSIDLALDGNQSAMIAALAEQGEVKTVSQPRVITLNNQPALVKIGQDVPFFSATKVTNPTTNVTEVTEEVKTITIGVILSVTPQISEDGWITLGIDPMISSFVKTNESKNGSTAPVTDVKQSSSMVRLQNGATVRISGLIQSKESEDVRKVPLLGDIPLLKYLFRWSYKRETRSELVIFITPKIIE